MKLNLLCACAISVIPSSSIASESAYEEAAKIEMAQLASAVLAASLCKGVRFNGDGVIPHLAVAAFLLGRDRAQESFFSAIRENIDAISVGGKEPWCAAAIEAAKQRHSELLTEDKPNESR